MTQPEINISGQQKRGKIVDENDNLKPNYTWWLGERIGLFCYNGVRTDRETCILILTSRGLNFAVNQEVTVPKSPPLCWY